MEKIEWLIDKLKRQYDAGATAAAMLATLQALQVELAAQNTVATAPVTGNITVLMPAPQWNANADALLDAWEAEEGSRGKDEEKVVFELDPYVDDTEEEIPMPEEEQEVPAATPVPDAPALEQNLAYVPPVTEAVPAAKPLYETLISVEKPAAKPLYETLAAGATPPPQPAPIHTAYMPADDTMAKQPAPPTSVSPLAVNKPASVAAVEMPKPLPDTDTKSLNDLHEKPANEVFVRLQEPIKDLKRAITINERYQYLNGLFKGDEATYDRSIKTINGFNVFSEAEYWIRRELSTKFGWAENDPLVQQFYNLVSRRFA